MTLLRHEPLLQLLVLERVDSHTNCQRYYVLSLSPTLFGDTALTREWGRIGSRGRSVSSLHADEACAREALVTWLRRKQRRNYRPVFAVPNADAERTASAASPTERSMR